MVVVMVVVGSAGVLHGGIGSFFFARGNSLCDVAVAVMPIQNGTVGTIWNLPSAAGGAGWLMCVHALVRVPICVQACFARAIACACVRVRACDPLPHHRGARGATSTIPQEGGGGTITFPWGEGRPAPSDNLFYLIILHNL